jgi:predicted small metal-binding protein
MFADEALRCECGYEVQASDEAGRVDEVRRHASATHGIDLSADVALEVVRRVAARAEQRTEERGGHLPAVAGDNRLQRKRPDAQGRDAAHHRVGPDLETGAESNPIVRGVDR